jgi:hypothetical protein
MNERLWPILALTCFASLGNGQDGALPPTPVNGWGTQGNLAWTKAQHDAELEKAALAARQKKALMNSMATVAHKPPTITTAEQYLQVYKPAVPRSPEGSGASAPITRSNPYVPQFENTTAPSGGGGSSTANAPASPPVTTPEKKSGLFGLFKTKEKEPEFSGGSSTMPLPPAAAYPEPAPGGIGSTSAPAPAPGTAPDMAPVDPAAREAALETATSGPADEKKPSLFGRLFSKDKDATPAPAPAAPSPYPAPGAAPAPAPAPTETAGGIPTPPSFDDPAPAMPAAPSSAPAAPATPPTAPPAPAAKPGSDAAPASIFVDRSRPAAAAPSASVLTTTQATVSGVLVRLYQGTQVSVLERNGSMARVRLPDGREGTIAASALSR